MNIGIKYELKRNVLNKQLQTLGSAVLFGGKTKYYFSNPLVALRVAKYLNSKNPNFKYSICKLPESFIKNKKTVGWQSFLFNYSASSSVPYTVS